MRELLGVQESFCAYIKAKYIYYKFILYDIPCRMSTFPDIWLETRPKLNFSLFGKNGQYLKCCTSGTIKCTELRVGSNYVIYFKKGIYNPVSYTHLDVYKRQTSCSRNLL